MIFATLGSQKFQFNRLLQEIDRLIEEGIIHEDVFAQTRYSDYKPLHYAYQDFLNREEFLAKIEASRLVITHGGTGAITGAVKQGKKVIAVPRLQKYGEHVDDHQIQLLTEFEKMNLILPCYELENLGEKIKEVETESFATFYSNTDKIVANIESYIDGTEKDKAKNKRHRSRI